MSLQLKIGVSYILVILGVLILLNTYPLIRARDMIFSTKSSALLGSADTMAAALAGLDTLTEENVTQALSVGEFGAVSRAIITDASGKILYDTREVGNATGYYAFYTELVQALEGNDAAYASYREGAFRSRAAVPVVYRNEIIGAVFVYEYDVEQAELLQNMQMNLLSISAGIGAAVLTL